MTDETSVDARGCCRGIEIATGRWSGCRGWDDCPSCGGKLPGDSPITRGEYAALAQMRAELADMEEWLNDLILGCSATLDSLHGVVLNKIRRILRDPSWSMDDKADLLTEEERKQVEFLEQEWFWNDDAVMALLTILRRIAPAPRAET